MELINDIKSVVIRVPNTNDNYMCNIINNSINNDRTDNNIYDSSDTAKSIPSDLEENTRTDDNINVNIYRYKFTNEFTDELYKFSKIHQYDHRKDFKEAWEKWTEENDDMIDKEIRRLTNLGYDGDILDKMFKSARYYFRKKSTEKKEPIKRRIYVGSQKDLLDAMDQHIKNNIKSSDFKPSDGFDEFCRNNIELLKEQVNQFVQSGIKDSNEIKNKIKKTYKNRYFIIISK
jgi:hypothetical protein